LWPFPYHLPPDMEFFHKLFFLLFKGLNNTGGLE
jgi:hypothetical protein